MEEIDDKFVKNQIEEEINIQSSMPIKKMNSEIKEEIPVSESGILKQNNNENNIINENITSITKSKQELENQNLEKEIPNENLDPSYENENEGLITNNNNNNFSNFKKKYGENENEKEKSQSNYFKPPEILFIPQNESRIGDKISEFKAETTGLGIGRQLFQMKKTRKQTELEAQILANRIALLKQEELKTIKKIKETKNKAEEIYKIKKLNLEKNQEKEKLLKKSKNHFSSNFLNHKEIVEKMKIEKDFLRATFLKQKREEIKQRKEEGSNNEKLKKNFLEKIYNNNLSKINFIKKQKIIGNIKIEEFKTNKIINCQKLYEQKLEEERKLAKKSEEEITEMEKMELDLIRKLQQSQLMQKNVYEELEGVLTLPVLEFENKFKIQNEQKEKKKKKKTNKKKMSKLPMKFI